MKYKNINLQIHIGLSIIERKHKVSENVVRYLHLYDTPRQHNTISVMRMLGVKDLIDQSTGTFDKAQKTSTITKSSGTVTQILNSRS